MVDMKGLIYGVVGLVVVLTLVSALVPSAVTTVEDTDNITGYSTWSTGTTAMWVTIGIFAVLAVLLMIIGIALKAID